MVECVIKGVPAGIGEPAFEKLDANLAKAVFSIGAVKSFEVAPASLPPPQMVYIITMHTAWTKREM